MASTLDELEEIERSARVGPTVGRVSPTPPAAAPVKGERRRGSSMFVPDSAMEDYKKEQHSPGGGGGEMLEDFPSKAAPAAKPQPPPQAAPVKPPENVPRPQAPVKRGSVALKPMGGLGGLVDFDDSDFDDSDEEEMDLPGAPMPGNAVGGPNHRPLVGGFAAAAYEAARAHHYSQMNKGKQPELPTRRGPPPSI